MFVILFAGVIGPIGSLVFLLMVCSASVAFGGDVCGGAANESWFIMLYASTSAVIAAVLIMTMPKE